MTKQRLHRKRDPRQQDRGDKANAARKRHHQQDDQQDTAEHEPLPILGPQCDDRQGLHRGGDVVGTRNHCGFHGEPGHACEQGARRAHAYQAMQNAPQTRSIPQTFGHDRNEYQCAEQRQQRGDMNAAHKHHNDPSEAVTRTALFSEQR